MKVTQLSEGQSAYILKIGGDDVIKNRLFSLGVAKHSKVTLLKHTLTKETYEIEVSRAKVALRKEEAEAIEVTHERD